ncbi:MAG: T9SS type A sorting domain-containing protein [Chlorobi bacterium]|nr:T9SS type A sorting domain-containing protein [Chlorobiota bacterium]
MNNNLNKYINAARKTIDSKHVADFDALRSEIESGNLSADIDINSTNKFVSHIIKNKIMKKYIVTFSAVATAILVVLVSGVFDSSEDQNTDPKYGSLSNTKRSLGEIDEEFQIPTTISGIRMLELTEKEFAALNIQKKDYGYSMIIERRYTPSEDNDSSSYKARFTNKFKTFAEYKLNILSKLAKKGYDTSQKQLLVKTKQMFKVNRINTWKMKYRRWNNDAEPGVYPELITSEHFKGKISKSHLYYSLYHSVDTDKYTKSLEILSMKFAYSSTDELRKLPLMNKLIPIKFHVGDPDALPNDTTLTLREQNYTYAEVILWYMPTEEFLEALPDRYEIPIREELGLMKEVADGNITHEELCEKLSEDSYFNQCEPESESISEAKVYPNPVGTRTKCAFTLEKDDIVSIAVYELTGRKITDVITNKQFTAGVNTVEVNTAGLQKGMYLLLINQSQGEQTVVRFVVE